MINDEVNQTKETPKKKKSPLDHILILLIENRLAQARKKVVTTMK